MTGEIPELSSTIEMGLSIEGYRVCQLVQGSEVRSVGPNKMEVDFLSPDSLRAAHQLMAGSSGDPVGGIIHLLPLEPAYRDQKSADREPALRLAQSTFNLMKEFGADLSRSAEEGGGWMLNFTSFNGKFGVDSELPLPLAQAGVLGVVKSAGKELPTVRVKTIDLDPQLDPSALLEAMAAELNSDSADVEVGFTSSGRWTLELQEQRVANSSQPLQLDREAVVLITGGAVGITAEVSKAIAKAYSPRLVLVGRTPLPADEPAATADLRSPAELRKHFIGGMQRGEQKLTPAEVELAVKQILKDRQIRGNLAEMRRLGATVEYLALDVRDCDAFGKLLDDLYERYQRIDGVIHGAGVIEDKLIRDKPLASFTKVFETKVNSAVTLTKKLRSESLKFLIFFSSVSGRFGNVGQSDYSAANEYLNKLAQHLDQSWPGRVVSINWGPWDAGMVSDQLRQLYRERNIELLSQDEGVQFCLSELQSTEPGSPEVVISCSVKQIAEVSMKAS